jgi:hypothetical protein
MAYDEANPRMLELVVAKEILGELFDIRTHEVDRDDQAEDGGEDAIRSRVQFI